MSMREKGFSLIELIVVLAIIGILMAAATLYFHQQMQKAKVEQQVRTMYADLMNIRAKSIMLKTPLKVEFSTTQLVYKDVATGNVIGTTDLQYPIAAVASSTIQFDTLGFASGATFPMNLCVAPVGNTPAAIDGIQINQSIIQMGKVSGGDCPSASIAIN